MSPGDRRIVSVPVLGTNIQSTFVLRPVSMLKVEQGIAKGPRNPFEAPETQVPSVVSPASLWTKIEDPQRPLLLASLETAHYGTSKLVDTIYRVLLLYEVLRTVLRVPAKELW